MSPRFLAATMVACGLALSGASVAQTSPIVITFQVPLNLTQLSADISKVMVSCAVQSSEQTGAQRTYDRLGYAEKTIEIPVTGGQIATTVAVAVSIDNPGSVTVGTSASYGCNLTGFSESLQRWSDFSDAADAVPFRLIPTPQVIAGSFVW